MAKIKVGILGATGAVGQRFIELLENHPWFEVAGLGASERSAGKKYSEAVEGRWKISGKIPDYAKDMVVTKCNPEEMKGCKLVFSAMDNTVAGPVEEEFAKAGIIVSSNSKNHRMDDDVPLMIPEVNPDHLDIIEKQKERWGSGGFIVTNPNCSTIGLVLALKPIHDAFGIEKINVVTMQALSGAGYPGVPSMDILDNVVPFIGGEEDKVETEPLKLFGKLTNDGFEDAVMEISAQCNRVNVKDGHLECVSVAFENRPDLEELKNAFREFAGMPQAMELPSAPNPVIHVFEEDDRPQPRVDRDLGNGMAVSVGRIREDSLLDYKFIILSHNTIRGAAGASILNAELMHKKGLLK